MGDRQVNDLIAGLICVAGIFAIGYRVGHSKGFDDGRGHVFDEITNGGLPACYKRMGHIVGFFSPFFQKPLAPPPAVLDTPSWFSKEQPKLSEAEAKEGWTTSVKPTPYVHPFLNGANHG